MAIVESKVPRVIYLSDLEQPAIIVKLPFTQAEMIGESITMFAFETSDGVLLGKQTVVVVEEE